MKQTNAKLEEWISVEDRLPKKKAEYFYLVYKQFKITGRKKLYGCMAVELFENGHFESTYVTHWMPLPKPPQSPNKSKIVCNG